MKAFLLITLFTACTSHISFFSSENGSVPRPIKFGATGRYCVSGSMDLNSDTPIGINMNHYCGVHMLDYRACVSITYSHNTLKMGCDNDEGFSTCNHDQDNYYMSDGAYVHCCNEDHCNDCTNYQTYCYFPKPSTVYAPPLSFPNTTTITTTTTTTTTSTTTPLITTTKKSCAIIQELSLILVLPILIGSKTLS